MTFHGATYEPECEADDAQISECFLYLFGRAGHCSERRPRLSLSILDKLFWIALRRFWSGWKQALIIVTPETAVRWHRVGFRMYWRLISKVRRPVGRNQTPREVRELIFRMVVENPTWGAPRIHGELLMLGFGARPFLSLIGAFTRTAGSYRVEPHFRSFFVSPESVTILPRLQQ